MTEVGSGDQAGGAGDRARLVGQLPDAHAVALRLTDAGFGRDVVAVALGIAPQGVPDLLLVAEAKLRRLAAGT